MKALVIVNQKYEKAKTSSPLPSFRAFEIEIHRISGDGAYLCQKDTGQLTRKACGILMKILRKIRRALQKIRIAFSDQGRP